MEVWRCQPTARGGHHKPKPFKYENMWQSHGEYMEFVNRAWDPGEGAGNLESVAASLASLQGSLKAWDREVFGAVKKQVTDLRTMLEEERSKTLYRGPTDRERDLMAKLSDVLAREETMEHQRSRIAWLCEGDRNTTFFQEKAHARGGRTRLRDPWRKTVMSSRIKRTWRGWLASSTRTFSQLRMCLAQTWYAAMFPGN